MKKAYRKPSVVHYGREEIMDLIGPVVTQYPCECSSQVQPNPIPGKQFNQLQISFSTTGDCPEFERVIVTVPGSDPFIFFDFPRASGTEIGDTWSITVPNFQYLGNAGTYDFEINLTDAAGTTTLISCDTTVVIQ